MILEIENYVEPIKPRLYIAKPNREIIGELNEAYDIQANRKLGNIPELRFKIPYHIDQMRKLKPNPNIDKIRNRFLIKFVEGNKVDWFIVKTPADSMEDTDYKEVQCYGLAYQLSDKNIRNYSATSINATAALTVALAESNWKIGQVDASFDVMYRSFNVANSDALNFVFDIAKTFNSLVDFDTVNRTVSFLVFDTYGMNRGLEVSYGNLLKSAKKVENTDEFYTRLKVFGANGVSIQGQNPIGSNYIEDYSYFIQGYQEDEDGNVIGHSTEGMSDSLCKALITYKNKVKNAEGTYRGYLTQLTTHQETLTSQQNVLTTLQNELAIIEDNIAAANYRNENTSALVTQKNSKQTEIDSQKGLISTTETNITTVNNNIATLQNTLSVQVNFTQAQIEEWNDYIVVGTYENNNITDSKQLLQLATEEFEKLKQPKIIVEISIVNFLECVSEQARWGMLNLGDTIKIKQTKLGLNVEAKIIEMNFDYEQGDVSLVISNVKELLSDTERFIRDLYRANTTSNVVSGHEWKWNDAVTGVDQVSKIISETWNTVDREIVASVNNEVSINRKGIVVSDITDPNKMLIIQKGLLAISTDSGNTWKSAILPDRIVAERILGKIILGNNMIIGDNNGTFNIVGNLLTIKDTNDIVRVLLGEYQTGKYGLKLLNKSGTATILDEDGIIQTDTVQLADNVDSTHPLKLKFYIDDGVISVRKVKLNFSIEKFRAYSTGAASGGGSAITSANGGGGSVTSASGGSASVTSAGGGGATYSYGSVGGINFGNLLPSEKNFLQYAGTHNHGDTSWSIPTTTPDHYHVVYNGGSHIHGMYDFYLAMPQHTHSVNIPDHTHIVTVPIHAHTVDVPAHTHGIVYGIYESTTATNVKVKVDGIFRDATGYNTDKNIDLTQWITTSGWHTVELTSDTLGRINAGLYISSFVSV